MVKRYVIKLTNENDVCSVENFFAQEEFKNKIFLKRFSFTNEDEQSKEHFLFYESENFIYTDFLDKLNIEDEESQSITEVEEFSEEFFEKFNEDCPDIVYITNFPNKFTNDDLSQLLSCVPNSYNGNLKIERLPCVFKIIFNNSENSKDWILSILRFCSCLSFNFNDSELKMSVESNCLCVPVVHFIDLPPSLTTIDYFIEVLKKDLGDFKLYEENDRKDNHSISFNISYQTDEEAWDAISQLNFHQFEGKEIRVNHFIDVKYLQKISAFNIKVTNYDGSMDSYEIYEQFSHFGPIYSIYNNIQTMTNSNPQKDFFCIQYYVKENAEKAIKNAPIELNMENLKLTIKDAGLVIYNFHKNVTEAEVKDIFQKAIKIVIKQSRDKNSRPYVFVNFICPEDCEEAKATCNEIYSKNLRLMCVPQTLTKDQAFSERRKEEERCQKINTIFLQKIPEKVFAEDVIEACSYFGDGKIDSAVFIDIKNGKTRKRLAKISFHEKASFDAAMSGTITFNGRSIKPMKYIPHSH